MAGSSLRFFTVSGSAERGVLARIRKAATGMIEDARTVFRRARKGLEPVDKVSGKQVSVPADVVAGQYGTAIIAKKDGIGGWEGEK